MFVWILFWVILNFYLTHFHFPLCFLPHRAIPTAVSRSALPRSISWCVWFIPNPTLSMAPCVPAGQRMCVMTDKLNHETVNNWTQSVIRFHEPPSRLRVIHMYIMMRHNSYFSLQIFRFICKWFMKHSVISWTQLMKFIKPIFLSLYLVSVFVISVHHRYWHHDVTVTAVVINFVADWL